MRNIAKYAIYKGLMPDDIIAFNTKNITNSLSVRYLH